MSAFNKKPRAKPRHIEDDLQRDVMAYLKAVLLPTALAWHTPNGGKRSLREAGRLKAQGVLRGVSDVLIIWKNVDGLNVACIELKSPTGTLEASQKDFLSFAAGVGCYTGVARSLDDVRGFVRAFDVPTREAKP